MQTKVNILLIGSGGREHAMAKAFKKSVWLNKLFIVGGNAGINQDATFVDIKANDFENIAIFCKNNNVDLVVVGPEAPLVEGIADFLESKGIRVFGPSKKASMLEGSKEFMKQIVTKYGVPTAEFRSFDNEKLAKDYVIQKGVPIVIKTDGLAAGKGVTVAFDIDSAINAIEEAFAGKFGGAGKRLVIEEFLEGEEASFFVLCDGKNILEFGSAQDHKRALDNDQGPNTGGMGTYSPAPIVTDMVRMKVLQKIIEPTISGLAKEGICYKGFLFAGLMIDNFGNPKLIEYNIRMGDPETQSILTRLESDLVELLFKAADGKLNTVKEVRFSNDFALCVVMAAKGYPEDYKKGSFIDVSSAEKLSNVVIYHAGTDIKNNQLVSSGGRVLSVTGIGSDIKQAYDNAYKGVKAIKFDDGFYRSDIGYREIARK
jgi:phosphoribosylamine--glycine ligase